MTNVAEHSRSVEDAGADAVSLINTLMGMAIDIEKRRPVLSIATLGGAERSGCEARGITYGMASSQSGEDTRGRFRGIMNVRDAIEFLLAGASAIEIGTD